MDDMLSRAWAENHDCVSSDADRMFQRIGRAWSSVLRWHQDRRERNTDDDPGDVSSRPPEASAEARPGPSRTQARRATSGR
jgi:hypothetical protein